ncbi:MAG: transglycosylase SLT domain-containing protein [Gammaproteobacteria bacterium]
MLKVITRLFIISISLLIIYIIFSNVQFTSLDNFNKKKNIFVKFQEFPEFALPNKEQKTGYQYELVVHYLDRFNKKLLVAENDNLDINIYYTSNVCADCVVIKNEDLLLIGTESNPDKYVETTRSLNDISYETLLENGYNISFTNESIDELIEDINNGLISNILISRSTYLFYKKYFPNLKIRDIVSNIHLVWEFVDDDGTLKEDFLKYIKSKNTKDFIANLESKYYSKNSISSYIFIGSRIFITDMITKLPQYELTFREVSKIHNLDWKLLAAIAYQESKWDNQAVSPTGVRGLMMLTKNTAKMLKVDRLNPNESIEGGARYLKSLLSKFSKFNQTTRVHLALAAYNLGPGHVDDILLLATRDNKNIDDWKILKSYLHKLNQKKFYLNMKYGYARGWEAVQYVENVKQYYDIITFLDNKDKQIKDNIFDEAPKTL